MLPGYINQQESMAASEPVMTIDEANSCQVVFTHVKPYHRLLLKAGKLIYSVSLQKEFDEAIIIYNSINHK